MLTLIGMMVCLSYTGTALQTSLRLLLRVSQVNDSVVFKITLEYWSVLVADLFQVMNEHKKTQPQSSPLMLGSSLASRVRHSSAHSLIYY